MGLGDGTVEGLMGRDLGSDPPTPKGSHLALDTSIGSSSFPALSSLLEVLLTVCKHVDLSSREISQLDISISYFLPRITLGFPMLTPGT